MREEIVKTAMESTDVRRALVGLAWRLGLDCHGVGLEGAAAGAKDFEGCIQPDGRWDWTDRGSDAKRVVEAIVHHTLSVLSPRSGEDDA